MRRFPLDFSSYYEYGNPQELSEYYSAWSKSINEHKDERIHAIELYCGYISEKVNQFLRGNEDRCLFLDTIRGLDGLLSSSPSLKNNTILYRALPLPVMEIVLASMKANGYYLEKGFLSTSISLKGISNIDRETIGRVKYVLKLYVPKRTPALYVEDIEGSGMDEREEQEVILPRDSKIRPINRPFHEKEFGYWIFECIVEYDHADK